MHLKTHLLSMCRWEHMRDTREPWTLSWALPLTQHKSEFIQSPLTEGLHG